MVDTFRAALGATTRDVLSLIFGRSLRQALIGVATGAVLALGVARLVSANIQGMPVFDAVAFVGAVGCVLMACLLAAFAPSWRAAQVQPTVALRAD